MVVFVSFLGLCTIYSSGKGLFSLLVPAVQGFLEYPTQIRCHLSLFIVFSGETIAFEHTLQLTSTKLKKNKHRTNHSSDQILFDFQIPTVQRLLKNQTWIWCHLSLFFLCSLVKRLRCFYRHWRNRGKNKHGGNHFSVEDYLISWSQSFKGSWCAQLE